MKHYSVRVHLRPELRYGLLLAGASLPQAFMHALEDVIISHWQSAPTGGDHLRLEFSRPSEKGLLAEIQAAAVQVGYALVEAEIKEFVDNAVRGAVVGFCGGGVAGAKTRNPLLALIAAAIGGFVGERAGASMRTLIDSRRYQLHRSGRWIVTELPITASQQPVSRPDPTAAFLPA